MQDARASGLDHAVIDLSELHRMLGKPSVSVAVESKPNVLRYGWPCGCSAFGVGGPKCLARRCPAHGANAPVAP